MLKKFNFVVSKTPLRISFLGGGTDISYFYRKYEGSTLSAAIDKFVYVTVKRHTHYFIEKYRLNYYETENCNSVKDIKNSIIRETIKYFKIKSPLYISIISDVPSGTGLGGSSSCLVGLINALCKLESINLSKKEMFELATHIEINVLSKPIGKQDHIPAVYGGLTYSVYKKNDTVKIKKLDQKFLKIPMKIFWTNKIREAHKLLKIQKNNFVSNYKNLVLIKNISDTFCKKIFKKNSLSLRELINAVNDSWSLKKSLNSQISFSIADKFIDYVKKESFGAKILGAGGGGFILVLGNLNKFKIRKKYKTMINETVTISKEGSKILIAK